MPKLLFLLLCLSSAMATASECVILLHGLTRSAASMNKMEAALQKQNYKVVNQDYASTKHSVAVLAQQVIPTALSACEGSESVHFVTHSLGGILVRYYIKHNTIENLGRVVMLGPPNQGSEVVDKLGGWKLFQWFNGPAGGELGTAVTDMPKSLGGVDFELGIIAGRQSINLILSRILPGIDDGKVTIASTKLDGMTDHRVMAATHPFIMKNKKVIKQTLFFLKHGFFTKPKNKN